MFIGFAIATVGALALISLWQGNPRPFGGFERLSGAAGITGASASWPLGKMVSGIGVAIVWGGAVLLGLLIFTGTPLSAIWDRIVDAFSRDGDEELDEDDEGGGGGGGGGRRTRDRARERRLLVGRAPRGRWAGGRVRADRGARARPADRRWALRAPAARAAPNLPAVGVQRTGRGAPEGRARRHVPHVRRARPRRGGAPGADRHAVRGRDRGRHQGEQGALAGRRHRVRARDPGRADHRADPRSLSDRRRGAEQGPRLRDARRHPALEDRARRRATAGGRPRQGCPRAGAARGPHGHAPRADRRAQPAPASRASSTRSSPRS